MGTGVELLLLAGAAASTVYGAQQQADAAADQAKAIGQQSAEQAGRDQDAAAAEAERIRKAGRAQVAEANAALSASGVSVTEGTPLLIDQDIYARSEFDAMNAILSGERRVREADQQRKNANAQAKAASQAAWTGAVTSLLGQGAGALKASGWRSNGPGWSGTQAPAPVETRTIKVS